MGVKDSWLRLVGCILASHRADDTYLLQDPNIINPRLQSPRWCLWPCFCLPASASVTRSPPVRRTLFPRQGGYYLWYFTVSRQATSIRHRWQKPKTVPHCIMCRCQCHPVHSAEGSRNRRGASLTPTARPLTHSPPPPNRPPKEQPQYRPAIRSRASLRARPIHR